jgi:phage baseplate assembly protein W
MAIPQVIRVNPLDLQKNIAIGVALPFGLCGTDQLFNKTYSTKDQIKSNLINVLLTNRGERILNPSFGSNLKLLLFEPLTEVIKNDIRNTILSTVNIYIPEITITNINIDDSNYQIDNNTVSIAVNYRLNISGTSDQILIQFQ